MFIMIDSVRTSVFDHVNVFTSSGVFFGRMLRRLSFVYVTLAAGAVLATACATAETEMERSQWGFGHIAIRHTYDLLVTQDGY